MNRVVISWVTINYQYIPYAAWGHEDFNGLFFFLKEQFLNP